MCVNTLYNIDVSFMYRIHFNEGNSCVKQSLLCCARCEAESSDPSHVLWQCWQY